jgi:hypothetical protein
LPHQTLQQKTEEPSRTQVGIEPLTRVANAQQRQKDPRSRRLTPLILARKIYTVVSKQLDE